MKKHKEIETINLNEIQVLSIVYFNNFHKRIKTKYLECVCTIPEIVSETYISLIGQYSIVFF